MSLDVTQDDNVMDRAFDYYNRLKRRKLSISRANVRILASQSCGQWLRHVTRFLQAEDLARVRGVCKQWSIEADDEMLWKLMFKWPILYRREHKTKKNHIMSWKTMVATRWRAQMEAAVRTRAFGKKSWKTTRQVCPVCCCFKVLATRRTLKRHLEAVHGRKALRKVFPEIDSSRTKKGRSPMHPASQRIYI